MRDVTRRAPVLRATILTVFALALTDQGGIASAQTAYKYRDSNGQWVFTDQPGAAATASESIHLTHESAALHISVDRDDGAESTQLIAVNDWVPGAGAGMFPCVPINKISRLLRAQ